MNVKYALVSGCWLLAAALLTAGNPNEAAGPRGRGFPPGGAAREWNAAAERQKQMQELSPEEKQLHNAARKRRFEIMVLLESYKIMPEADREPLRRELMKRIEEDLRQALTGQKKKLEAAEQDLDKLRKDVEHREKNASFLAEQELKRLLTLPPPWLRGKMHKNKPAEAETRRPDSCAREGRPGGALPPAP